MAGDFSQIDWDERLADDCRQIVRLAVREDLDRWGDVTTLALVDAGAGGEAHVVARQAGTIAGLPAAHLVLQEMNIEADWQPAVDDGTAVEAGQRVARVAASARSLLTSERLLLNLIGRLSGIATLTRQYVDAVAGTRAHIYDTRKTTPGWRRLEKYAVRRGGGMNHRTGLFDAVLIKDNHLAHGQTRGMNPAEAVEQARGFAQQWRTSSASDRMPIEVEVDTLEQLAEVLRVAPDIVLLDNMPPQTLVRAVAMRDATNPEVVLEASGGVNLATARAIAESGVERISVGALTHSAVCLDVALDWVAGANARA